MYYHNKYGAVAIEKGYVPAPSYLLRRSRILELASRFQPGKLLEIGCGGGGILCDMAMRGFSCVATETSDDARKIAEYITSQSGLQIPVLDKIQDDWHRQFDFVFSFEVLEHIENDQAALKEWAGLLAEGGQLLISVPAHMKKWGVDDAAVGHYRRYERDELLRKLTAAGFECLYMESWGFPLSTAIRPFRKMKYKNYLTEKKSHSESINMAEGSAMSGINRGIEVRLFPILESWPGVFVMWLFERIQKMFLRTDLGEGYLVIAKKVGE
jgi:SAM-dependent methyltransferase